MARHCVHIPWYATAFRKEDLGAALEQISAISLRYGARGYSVYQSHDDLYRFLQVVEFDSHAQWEAYWYGEEFSDMRAACSGWYQVPVLYVWNDIVAEGSLAPEPAELERS
jgi:quinol monooxygenase YgiN